MRDCNLTNVQLTEEQFVILNQLTVFDATVTVTECASGFEPRDLQKTKVCSATGKKESGGSNTVVIIVCVVGGVVVVGLLAFIVARRRRQPPIIDPTDKPTYTLYGDGTTGTLGDGSDTFASAIWNDPELQAARVDHRDVEPIKLLARGGFGEVWLGLYMGENMQDVTILQLVSAGKLQPSFSESCPPSILRLARSCLEFDASRRPTSMQIMYELRNILKNELKKTTSALALLLSAVAAAAVSVDAQSCDSLKQNTLTSVGCPATCLASAPCVVYAPSLNASKPCMELGSAVGKCQQQTAFSPPSAPTESCTVTYQCMEGIVTSGGQWLLALDNIKGASAVSMALVTEINSLVYNPTSTVSVQLAGGPTLSTRKGDMKEVVLDQSFFNTPTRATTMFLLHLNLRNALTTYKLNTNLKTLSLVNVNLDQVPAQLTSLTALTK
ncbi:hypothetical protein PybrP1_013232, partial [[Pythium] brassicae (nom. inval.)]